MRKLFTISLAVALSVLLLVCGESPEVNIPPAPGPGNNGTGPLTDEQRLAVLEECSDFVNSLGDLKSEAVQQVIVAWLKSRPEFEDAGSLRGNVWAYFHDGRAVMIVPNWRGPGSEEGGRMPLEPEGARKNKHQNERIGGQPGSNLVKLFFGFGRGFIDYRPKLKEIFAKSNTKYTVDLEEASIENLKNVKDVGVFFIDTHGGMGRRKPKIDAPGYLFGLWTTDTISVANEKKYKVDVEANFLVYMLALHNDPPGVNEWHYAITQEFVEYSFYMTFEENAILYIDGCNGMTPEAETFQEAMLAKAKNEKAVYIAWTGVTDNGAGAPAARFIFDRMLGTNTSIGAIKSEEPLQRPFDMPAIFEDMNRFKVDTYHNFPLGYSVYGGRISYAYQSDSDVILTPTIEYMGVDENESRLYIKGLFGDVSPSDATVSVGGVAIPVIFWGSDLIMCELPTVGPGSSGDVVVSLRKNKSNVVPLTEWTIPLDVTLEDAGGKLEASLQLRLRGDVHSYRSIPGEAPKKIRPDTLEMLSDPSKPGWPFAIGSKGTFNVGGGWFSTCEKDKCEITNSLSPASRNGVLAYVSFGTNDPHFSAFYKWSEDMKTVFLQLYIVVKNVGFEKKYRMLCAGQPPVESSQSINTQMDVETHIDLPVLKLQLDENYHIQRGNYSKFENYPWESCQKIERLGINVNWSGASPAFGPNKDTPARVAANGP